MHHKSLAFCCYTGVKLVGTNNAQSWAGQPTKCVKIWFEGNYVGTKDDG